MARASSRGRTENTQAVVLKEPQREKLAEMVRHARASSPYYRDLYKDLPERVEDPALLPVTQKKELMAHFDDWVTDRDVTLEKVQAFIADKSRIGEHFLGKYQVATTSGTTGRPGIFVLDQGLLQVQKKVAGRAFRQWLSFWDFLKILFRGGRMAMLHATDGHYVSVGNVAKWRRSSRLARKLIRDFSIHTPIPELVEELNRFRPAILGSYASVASLLAAEREAGRLRIDPVLIVVTAEGLPEEEYGRIEKAFGSKVGNIWGSTEASGAAYSCKEGWMHVLDDWMIIEPVDADYRPVPPGEPSHTVLITNLANHVQPLLRYDLGDSILVRPDPCPCGDEPPAIKVQGRSAEVLEFTKEGGEKVSVAPLALELSDLPGVELSQVVQTSPAALKVRLKLSSGADAEAVWKAATSELEKVFRDLGIGGVKIERGEKEPEQSSGGKIPKVVRLAK